MTNTEHLAIASVPVQKWETVYDEAQALCVGTIFPELNKPFFATVRDERLKDVQTAVSGNNNSQEGMLLMIQQISFVIDDLRLYLDTHPQDQEGLELLKSMLKNRKVLLKDFAKRFYPLTMDCMADIYEEDPASQCYCWLKGPIPWEGVCE